MRWFSLRWFVAECVQSSFAVPAQNRFRHMKDEVSDRLAAMTESAAADDDTSDNGSCARIVKFLLEALDKVVKPVSLLASGRRPSYWVKVFLNDE